MIKRFALSLIFALGMILGVSTLAGAQVVESEECGASPLVACDEVEVENTDLAPIALPAPKPAAPAAVPSQQLPVTGAESAAIALGGAVLLLAGGAMVWRSNKAAA